MNSVRPELALAYRNTFGRIPNPGKERAGAPHENVILASMTHKPSEREVERFRTHGIANIRLEINFASLEFVIDLSPLKQTGDPICAWLSNQKPGKLSLVISSGKQTPRKNAEIFNNERILEGVRIVFVRKSRQQIPAPYKASITPLYLDN